MPPRWWFRDSGCNNRLIAQFQVSAECRHCKYSSGDFLAFSPTEATCYTDQYEVYRALINRNKQLRHSQKYKSYVKFSHNVTNQHYQNSTFYYNNETTLYGIVQCQIWRNKYDTLISIFQRRSLATVYFSGPISAILCYTWLSETSSARTYADVRGSVWTPLIDGRGAEESRMTGRVRARRRRWRRGWVMDRRGTTTRCRNRLMTFWFADGWLITIVTWPASCHVTATPISVWMTQQQQNVTYYGMYHLCYEVTVRY